MTLYSKSEAVHQINSLSINNIPFLFIIDYKTEKCVVLPLSEVNDSEILFFVPRLSNAPATKTVDSKPVLKKHPQPFDIYKHKFDKVMQSIRRGDTYLLNLTCETPVEISYSLEDIFHNSRAKYKLLLKNHFVVFSPETFVRIQNGIISTNPMKGTIDASLPGAEALLMNSEKEIAEQHTIVDLMRNDLSISARNVTVEKFRYIEKLNAAGKELLQVSSLITGYLPVDYASQTGNILFSLLPAGSVTGAPKKKTAETIENIEGYERGYYTGVFGIFDGTQLDSAVMIRFIESKENGLVFKSGGGITAFSDAQSEYREMIDKVYVPFA